MPSNFRCANTQLDLVVTASVDTSVTPGVGPLGVVFHVVGSSSNQTTQPFHEVQYTWNFGDDDTALWSYGAHVGDGTFLAKKNRAMGPVAGHVYEPASGAGTVTYTWTCTAYDGVNTTVTTGTIQVTDPDTYYTAANTYIVSPTSNWTGAPAGIPAPNKIASGAFDTQVNALIASGKRVLFHAGESFTATISSAVTVAGPSTIGSYDTGKATINCQSSALTVMQFYSSVSDCRVMDLIINGQGNGIYQSDTGIAASITTLAPNILFLRNEIKNIGSGVINAGGSNMNNSVIQDCYLHDITNGNGIYGWFRNTSILGNNVSNSVGQHLCRIDPGQYLDLSSNEFSGSHGASGEACLTIRGFEHSNPNIWDTSFPNGTPDYADTYYIHVSDNKLADATTQPLQITPASATQNHWLYDIIAERNWIVASSTVIGSVVLIEAVRTTCRNNVVDCTGWTGFVQACTVSVGDTTGNVPAPDNNWFYNNTSYTSSATSSFYVFSLNSASKTITNYKIENNIAWDNNATQPSTIFLITAGSCSGTGASGTLGNSSTTQVQSTDPNFTNVSPFTPANAKPAGGSYAIGGNGSYASVPVFSDFMGATKLNDSGAVNH